MLPARTRFRQELDQPQINLARAALFMAQEEYPDLDPQTYLDTLDTMAQAVQTQLPDAPYPLRVIQTINRYLYDELGFQGNETDYYDPRNSFFNEVLERRTGIPITMALVYLEIAQRVGFPMVAVGMPGHLLIRPDLPEVDFFVDAFHRGEVLFPEDCQARLRQWFGPQAAHIPREPLGARFFLLRMLANLKGVYLHRQDLDRTLAAVERMLLLFSDAPFEVRDRGIIYTRLGRWREALADLEYYTTQLPTAQDAPIVRELQDQCRRQLWEDLLP
ncbi:SirB1 family protein [Candidatus Cyanaurora vandensis]|uniref:SirB1 family protein n=1 Tax=Candidatus Cyanaurora vandensis TaxID=2714958 RepID=UPI00257C2B7A|nr:tetratricopeptide repeat protein [Candidatus Cyanaurora vandensis]